MTFSNQHLIQHSPMFWLILLVTWLHVTTAMIVHVEHMDPSYKGESMPDQLNVTLIGESGVPIYLHLRVIEYAVPNVPVYTLMTDEKGKLYQHLEKLEDNQNIGYYQDVSSEAVIQVTRIKGDNGTYYELKGELNIGGKKFSLSPERRFKRDAVLPSSTSGDETYTLLPKEPTTATFNDYLEAPPEVELKVVESADPNKPGLSTELPKLNSSFPSSKNRHRRQSGSATSIFMDVVAVIDYSSYRRFLAISKTRTVTLQAMREYYALILSGVDLRYKSIQSPHFVFGVRLIKMIISESSTTSQYTEKFRKSSVPWDQVDAQEALKAFSDFAQDSGREALFPGDHAVLFTGYDLTSRRSDGSVSDSTTGLAYLSTMCRTDGKSVSLVEDLGGFQCVDTTAHEIGHSLSCKHDGDGNSCSSADRFIMSSGEFTPTPSNQLNSYLFSDCSIAAFTNYVNSKLEITQGTKCLLEKLPVNAVPDVSNRLPGQKFSADDQCQMIYGNASRMCRLPEIVCSTMFCLDPSTESTCIGHKAAQGTTCGNNKMCLNGQCVTDPRAPAVDDDCVFGDQPGIAFNGKTCETHVRDFSGYCYQASFRKTCCGSCKTVYRNVAGCEYGDTAVGCSTSHCRFGFSSQCCRTCNLSAPAAPVARGAAKSTTEMTARGSIRQTTVRPTTASQCMDLSNVLLNGLPCSAAVLKSPYLCNYKNVKDVCCSSCKSDVTNSQG